MLMKISWWEKKIDLDSISFWIQLPICMQKIWKADVYIEAGKKEYYSMRWMYKMFTKEIFMNRKVV